MPSISVLPTPPSHSTAHGLGITLSSSSKLPDIDNSSRRTGSSNSNGHSSFQPHNGTIGSSSSSSSMTSGGGSDPSEPTVASIKESVSSTVHSLRGASCLSLLRTASDLAIQGRKLENAGDVRGAFRAFLTAAQLVNTVMSHSEFVDERKSGRRGVVVKEFSEFQQMYGASVASKTKELQAKLLEIERSRGSDRDHTDGELPATSSVQDRLRALSEKGLNVQTTKRISRDLSSSSSPSFPHSPVLSSSASAAPPSVDWKLSTKAGPSRSPSQYPANISSSPLASHGGGHAHSSSGVSNHLTGSSVHSIIASSAAAAPAASSTRSPLIDPGSPYRDQLSFSEFNSNFPSIDELDEEMNAAMPNLPSVPTYKPGVGVSSSQTRSPPISPSVLQRFPSLPLNFDLGPRPASTPIPPTGNGLPSRPASPSRIVSPILPRSPLSPTVPPKPLKLTMTGSSSAPRASPLHTGTSGSASGSGTGTGAGSGDSPRSRPIDLPVTSTLHAKTLHDYLHRSDVRVLLIDMRIRDEFTKCRIRSEAIMCLEPHIILRDGMTSEKIEDALSVAPPQEYALFKNRDENDLVVFLDADSSTFGPSISPMSTAVRVIYEMGGYQKPLKRPPLILVGGLKAWKELYPDEVIVDAGSSLEAQMERMKLYSNSLTNGSTYTSYNPPSSYSSSDKEREMLVSPPPSSSESRLPSSAGSRHISGMDRIPENDGRPPVLNGAPPANEQRRLVRKPALPKPPSNSSILFNTRDNSSPYGNTAHASSSSSIVYPQYPRPSSSFASTGPSSTAGGIVSPPPTASINPSLARRRTSDHYVDQSEIAVSAFSGALRTGASAIDYPTLSTQHVVRPPPAVATPPSERQDQRRASIQQSHGHGHRMSLSGYEPAFPKQPLIGSEYPVSYWPENTISTAGLKNLGNTCYMNSTIQCLSATVPFSRFFTDGRWKSSVNLVSLLGTKGRLTAAFASILRDLWQQESPVIIPNSFKKQICAVRAGQQFAGSEQHDCQEFLNFLLDGLHEDLNRVLQKEPISHTPEREAELEVLPQQIASQQEWDLYRTRDNSIVVDFFQGQFRNRLQCLTCKKTSTTYNAFMYLTLPIPSGRNAKATLHQCLDAFVSEEVMEKEDAWNCPNCKALRRATKQLSISRLPPVLLIHLKRFTTKGHFTDKLETFVDFPLKGLDLTNYMPAPLPPGVDRKRSGPISLDDPRSQVPPYRYDLYAVTNHFGTLSSGHYTAFINSRGNWLYCDDSRISSAEAREVVGRPAYVLYYKRVQS